MSSSRRTRRRDSDSDFDDLDDGPPPRPPASASASASSSRRPPPSSNAPASDAPPAVHAVLASLRDRLRSSRATDRRAAAKELLAKLSDPATSRRLRREAERGFEAASAASSRGRGGRGGGLQAALPWERVCLLYRGLMDASLLAARTAVEGAAAAGGGRRRAHANQTGLTKRSIKFTADDVLFPHRVFLTVDAGQDLEVHDGGYAGSSSASGEEDWKTAPRHGHHLDLAAASSRGRGGKGKGKSAHGRFSASHYKPRTYADEDRGSRLSPKEIQSCVDYAVRRLNDKDCRALGTEASLLRWLGHVCARPEYLAALPARGQLSHVLHEVSIRLERAFVDGNAVERGILPPSPDSRPGRDAGEAGEGVSQEVLLACAKCLSALVYNSTCRLGTGMHLYIRPIVELVARWADDAWILQSEGAFASTSDGRASLAAQLTRRTKGARNPHAEMVARGEVNPSSLRRRSRSEADVMALMPYLYSSVTHLVAAHPEHAVPILGDCGHGLMRLARRNYARAGTTGQVRDALTEYFGAHLLVAEASGRLRGLPEGDLGPLVPREEEEEEESGENEEGRDRAGEEEGEGEKEGEEEGKKKEKKKEKKKKKKRKRRGATLDARSVSKLLALVRDPRVWESLFPPASAVAGGRAGTAGRRWGHRRSLPSSSDGRGDSLPDGGPTWNPLTRRQRRHLELCARLIRIAQRLHVAEAEDRDGGEDALDLIAERANEEMRRGGTELGEVDIPIPDRRKGGSVGSVGTATDDRTTSEGAFPSALARSPWIRAVGRHLYRMNPKFGRMGDGAASSATQGGTQLTHASAGLGVGGGSFEAEGGDASSCERILWEACPMLRALVVEEGAALREPSAGMTQGTLDTTFADPDEMDKATDGADDLRTTATAALQLLAACAESYPRGECWTSTVRTGWSATLDERPYPAGTAAQLRERHGGLVTDVASVAYLLGAVLERHGGGGTGEEGESIRLWCLVGLLKLTEASAVACSRDGVEGDVTSFAPSSALMALRTAWRHVWTVLLRPDLRYAGYTAGAFGGNAGELAVQLLTQIVRWRLVDRARLFSCRGLEFGPASHSETTTTHEKQAAMPFPESKDSSFVRGERGRLWKLPAFDSSSALFSCAPFELLASVVRSAGLADMDEGGVRTLTIATADSSALMLPHLAARDRRYFVSYCLHFAELCMEDAGGSNVRRSFLPHAAACLASVISDGGVASLPGGASTYELDGLTRFGVTEDTTPLSSGSRYPADVGDGAWESLSVVHNALWAECVPRSECYLHDDMDVGGLALRIVQGRGALLNRYSDAQNERCQLRRHIYRQEDAPRADAQRSVPLGIAVHERVKSILSDLLFRLRYGGGEGTGGDDDKVSLNKSLALAQLTGCLSLILSSLLSRHSGVEQVSRDVITLYPDLFAPALDVISENMPRLRISPSDLHVVFSHLNGIVQVLTFVAALGGDGISIPRLFGDQAKSLFTKCKATMKDYRNEACTSGQQVEGAPTGFDSDDSEDKQLGPPTQLSHTQRLGPSSNYSDSDGLMDEDECDENRDNHRRQRRAPPSKRRRMANGSLQRPRAKRDLPREQSVEFNITDSRGAWACASLMLSLQPSFQCLEVISSHLVWPEDNNYQAGYGTVSRTPDPLGALVCAKLFCRKSVLLRRDRLDLKSSGGGEEDEDEDQASALILSVEAILQARRYFSPSSRYFMCGMGLVASMVGIGDYSDSCGPIGVDESKIILEALHPEGVGKESEDYHLLRQWKRILRFRGSYRAEQVRDVTIAFLYAQKNVRKEFEGPWFWNDFILPCFRHVDENVRILACDVLGAALGVYPDQAPIVSDVLKNALPRLDNEKKFKKWVDSLADMKIQEDLTALEGEALCDAQLSIERHTIECMGLIAGSTDIVLGKEMIWKLLDLAAKKPECVMPCLHSCKRASFLLGFRSLSAMFDAMMPDLLVKWLESRRSLHELPILLMSPLALEKVCHYLPSEILSMLLSEGGWSDDFLRLDEAPGDSRGLKESVLTSFVESVAKFLVPNILLSASDDGLANDSDNKEIDATKTLTECVVILTGADSDENVAKVLCNHISDLYGFVAVLAENGDATEECENAFKLLKRCVSSVHIERTGARSAFLVLRHILMLHRSGISVVGLGNIELTPASFIEGMKYVSRQLKAPPSNRKNANFLEQLGSSMTESFVLVKYWLSTSLTAQQREASWGTMALLCEVLLENIQHGRIEAGELGFCLHSFIAVLLDPRNYEILPLVLESLKSVLDALFSNATREALVDGVIAILHKLSLALLQTHQRSSQKLFSSSDSSERESMRQSVVSLRRIEYEQKSCQGLLSALDDGRNSWDCLGEAPWKVSPNRDEMLKYLVKSKASLEERVSSETMIGAYECLETIANGKTRVEDILGAEDIVFQCNQVLGQVNKKYSMSSFMQQRSMRGEDRNMDAESEHFIRIMNEHPISDDFDSSTSYSSHAILARLLALRRLEQALLTGSNDENTEEKAHPDVYPLLLTICLSGDPEESRVISSRCLGQLKTDPVSVQEEASIKQCEMDESLNDPIASIKRTLLTMLGQYLLSDCAETSLIAMKTAKALLVTPAGKQCWQSLNGDTKALLSPFNTVDDGKLRKEAVRVSESCVERLKSLSGSHESSSWCWTDELWTSFLDAEDGSCDLWLRKVTSCIILCCFAKGSKVGKGDQDFFRICQGLCAKEASFAAAMFPALIFYLLDSEARDQCKESSSVRDIVLSTTAIGSPSSQMNKVISHCFSQILSPNTNCEVAPKAITVILNTLELLRAITEHRFLTSPEHVKNKSSNAQKSSNPSKKRRSRASDSSEKDAIASSPKWRGFPYGVVLRVPGLDVAKACFRVRRYYSALYYAEMSMVNTIGSGTFLEDVATDSKHAVVNVNDISGFGVLSGERQDDKTVLHQASLAQDIIASCLSEIHAKDELQGVEAQGSALKLKRNITSLSTLQGYRRGQTLSMLLDLDCGSQASVNKGSNVPDGFTTIASCLEDLGLNHIKHHYLAGIGSNLGAIQASDRSYLREKWFEDSLNKTAQWDETLLPRRDAEEPSYGELNCTAERTPPSAFQLASQPVASFYESVQESLQSFARDDVPVGMGHILQGRKSVLRDMEKLAGSEAQSTGMVAHLTKLNILNQLELVARTLEGESSLPFLLNRWGFPADTRKGSIESVLLYDNVDLDTREQADVDGALFRSLRTGYSVREISLKILSKKFSLNQDVAYAMTSHICTSCRFYREIGHPDAAKVSLSSLRSLMQIFQKDGITNHSPCTPLILHLEDAKILKSQKLDGQSMAIEGAIMGCKMISRHLANTTADPADNERDQILAESLLQGGLWMSQHNVDSAESILSSFFEKAAALAIKIHQRTPSSSSVHRASMASFKLGEFAANLYNSVEARISSEAWKRRLLIAVERKKELQAVEAQLNKLKKKSRGNNDSAFHDVYITHSTLTKENDMDDRELKSVETSIQRYLRLAVESYCTALKLCPPSMSTNVSKHVFGLVSLWFKNCQRKETKDIVNDLLQTNLSQIPSYRLVPLTYQLFSRIDAMEDDDGFQNVLRFIVKKICSEHPYHGLVQLLALSNGKRIGDGVNGRHAKSYLENVGSTKVDAVNDIIEELRKAAPAYVSALIDSYQILMNSYMSLAEFDTSSIQKRQTKGLSFKQYKLDLDSCLSGGRRGGKNNVATSTCMPVIITKPPPIRPDAQYGSGTEDPIGTERVVAFETSFDLTLTGLHRPKIVKCIGSKGSKFKQLVKGEDDLRQDAIMQQVFGTVNDLLRHEGSGGNYLIKKSLVTTRQLRLITYGITPLSPASGVLEWVNHTMCFGDFLTDRGKTVGAHSRYYPGEWGNSDVREFYKTAGDARNATPESKRKAFETICENFSPAFRFFFLEYFKTSMEAWHTARTSYTRSCAVNSIVGHILGIGDRHTSNILVHTKTGEVVHIDFGIVFEQGKTLTTPELVPFRLTRDVVDGMGPSGTDGVFSKAAEATMSVMRNNADTLLTILSAVVSDPLYKWSLSPLKANQHQRNDDENHSKMDLPSAWMTSTMDESGNDAADRAIAKIHEKLEGYEDGTSGEHKTVAGQVKLLINEARDPGNLCMMFGGWAPWM